MNGQELKKMLEPIYEHSELWEVDLIFSEEIELTKEEFKDLVKNADPLQLVNDNGIFNDFYEWWEFENQFLELEVDYYVQNDRYYILEMHFWRKVKK